MKITIKTKEGAEIVYEDQTYQYSWTAQEIIMVLQSLVDQPVNTTNDD